MPGRNGPAHRSRGIAQGRRAEAGDFVYDGTTGKRPFGTDLLNRYMERVTIAAQHDDGVALRFNEVVALVRRPETLLAPGFVLRVLRVARRGPAGTPAAGSVPPAGGAVAPTAG